MNGDPLLPSPAMRILVVDDEPDVIAFFSKTALRGRIEVVPP